MKILTDIQYLGIFETGLFSQIQIKQNIRIIKQAKKLEKEKTFLTIACPIIYIFKLCKLL